LTEKEAIIEHAKSLDGIDKWLAGQTIKKEFYILGKIVSLVI